METNSNGDRNTFIDSPSGAVIAEGGRGVDGDRYGLFPRDANRAWYLGFGGWATDLLAWGLGLVSAGTAGFLVWRHVRQARRRRRWLAGLPPPPPAGNRPTVAVVYGATVAVLVVTGAAFGLRGQVASGYRFATLQVPALASHGLTTVVKLATGGRASYTSRGQPEPEHEVRISEEDPTESDPDLDLNAQVIRYASDSQAQAAEQEYLKTEARIGTRHRVADGTEIILIHGLHESNVGWVSASAVRGHLLVTLTVRDRHQLPATASVVPKAEPRMVTQAPLIRDVLAANASRIDEVPFPWWG